MKRRYEYYKQGDLGYLTSDFYSESLPTSVRNEAIRKHYEYVVKVPYASMSFFDLKPGEAAFLKGLV